MPQPRPQSDPDPKLKKIGPAGRRWITRAPPGEGAEVRVDPVGRHPERLQALGTAANSPAACEALAARVEPDQMAHPLLGADLRTLSRVFRDGGGADRGVTALGIWTGALARQPLSLLERAFVDPRLPPLEEIRPPVFILGHWRSGTTHLYNVLSRGGFGYLPPLSAGLPWDMYVLARALRPLLERQLPEHRYVDAIPVTPASPQEDEIALASMSPLSFYHGIYFPRAFDRLIERGIFFDGCSGRDIEEWQARFRYLMRKLAWGQSGRLLMKNPVHTARPAMLRETFPGAKFIHLHRNPHDVFLSMRHFYSRLLEGFALQAVPEDLDIDGTILRVYARMMECFEAQTAGWGAPDFVELPYDLLAREPLVALERIYATLELEGFDAALPRFRAYLASVRDFRQNVFSRDPETERKVEDALGPWLRKWGYARPGAA